MTRVSKEALEKIKMCYFQGLSVRQIAEMVGVSKTTVHRIIQKLFPRKEEDVSKKLYKELSSDFKKRLKELLLFTTVEKGETRVLTISQIYRILRREFREEMSKCFASQKAFESFVKYFIKKRFGSEEQLEKKRRGFKERAKYHLSRGALVREKAFWEIDATGYTYQGVQYSILQAVDRLTGFAFPAFILPNREKNTKYYNKAFSSYEVGLFLMRLFRGFGKPARIITDNEAILTSEFITRGLLTLGIEIKRTIPGNPNQKLIERIFRELKSNVREVMASHNLKEFKDIWFQATFLYNSRPHKTVHLGEVIPAELVEKVGVSVAEVSEEELEFAFAERYERTLRDGKIQIDNMFYELIVPGVKVKKVICYRMLNDMHSLLVYDEEGNPLGRAKLITRPLSEKPLKHSQLKREMKRIERRLKKISEEKEALYRRKDEILPKEEPSELILPPEEQAALPEEEQKREELRIDFLELAERREEALKENLLKEEVKDEDTCIFDLTKVH